MIINQDQTQSYSCLYNIHMYYVFGPAVHKLLPCIFVYENRAVLIYTEKIVYVQTLGKFILTLVGGNEKAMNCNLLFRRKATPDT